MPFGKRSGTNAYLTSYSIDSQEMRKMKGRERVVKEKRSVALLLDVFVDRRRLACSIVQAPCTLFTLIDFGLGGPCLCLCIASIRLPGLSQLHFTLKQSQVHPQLSHLTL